MLQKIYKKANLLNFLFNELLSGFPDNKKYFLSAKSAYWEVGRDHMTLEL